MLQADGVKIQADEKRNRKMGKRDMKRCRGEGKSVVDVGA
jgi:hypothetical protein